MGARPICECCPQRKGKYKREKPMLNIILHESGLVKNRFDERIALACAFQRMDDRQISQKGIVVEENGNFWA